MSNGKLKAKEIRKVAWNSLKGHYFVALLAALIAGIFGVTCIGLSFPGLGGGNLKASEIVRFPKEIPDVAVVVIIVTLVILFVVSFVMTVLSSSVALGYGLFNIRLIKGENPGAGDCFSRMKHIWKAFGLSLLVAVKIFLWSLLLIVPGIIAAYRYSMAHYVMAENPEISITEAINRSKEIMKGEKWNLFCMQLSFIWWILLALIVPGVGLFFLTPYTSAADAAFYLDRTGR